VRSLIFQAQACSRPCFYARSRQLPAAVHSDFSALGACLSIWREPRWLGEAADARRAAPAAVVGSTVKPRSAADAPHPANPKGPGRFPLTRRCRLLIGA